MHDHQDINAGSSLPRCASGGVRNEPNWAIRRKSLKPRFHCESLIVHVRSFIFYRQGQRKLTCITDRISRSRYES